MPQLTKSESSLETSSNPSSALSRFIKDTFFSRRKVFFDSPGLLEQSHHWGGLVIWTIAAGTTAGLLWAFLGRVDQTVTANGTLQPLSGKMIVSSPAGGIVREVFKVLAQVNVNVEELSTRAYSAPDSGGILFEAKARLSCSSMIDREEIRTYMEKIALDVLVDIRVLD